MSRGLRPASPSQIHRLAQAGNGYIVKAILQEVVAEGFLPIQGAVHQKDAFGPTGLKPDEVQQLFAVGMGGERFHAFDPGTYGFGLTKDPDLLLAVTQLPAGGLRRAVPYK